jgi:hypothetical protein
VRVFASFAVLSVFAWSIVLSAKTQSSAKLAKFRRNRTRIRRRGDSPSTSPVSRTSQPHRPSLLDRAEPRSFCWEPGYAYENIRGHRCSGIHPPWRQHRPIRLGSNPRNDGITLFKQTIVRTSPEHLRQWVRVNNIEVIGASPDGTEDYRAASYTTPAVLMLGGERKGLTEEQRSLCNRIVRIPMAEGMDSLNVAVAGSLLMYEVFRSSLDHAQQQRNLFCTPRDKSARRR